MNGQYDEAPQKEWWQGRMDGNQPEQQRWWQIIQLISQDSFPANFKKDPVLLGFACDEGVKRNGGRPGTAEGTKILRKACAHLPNYRTFDQSIYDSGNVICRSKNLEAAQEQ